jgi:hypothetical protein
MDWNGIRTSRQVRCIPWGVGAGVDIITPTFWEMYWNASGWVLDEFLRRLKAAIKAELGP